jgi:putative salt-induced outer membrane protein YdiY
VIPRLVNSALVVLALSAMAVPVIGAQSLAAQDGETSPPMVAAADTGKPKPPPPPWWTFHADLGVVATSGNTNVTTSNASDAFNIWTDHSNKIGQTFSVVYGTNNHKVQTSIWNAGLRDAYTFSPTVGLYALGAFDRNTFAGIEQRFEEGAGAAITAVNSGANHLEIDLGLSAIQQRSTAGVEDNFLAGRGALIYRYTFVKDTYFQETLDDLSDLSNFSNYRINSATDLVAPISKHIAIKVGYKILYSNQPPPGFKTTDRILSTDLQFNF